MYTTKAMDSCLISQYNIELETHQFSRKKWRERVENFGVEMDTNNGEILECILRRKFFLCNVAIKKMRVESHMQLVFFYIYDDNVEAYNVSKFFHESTYSMNITNKGFGTY